jgi:hypothetical protein
MNYQLQQNRGFSGFALKVDIELETSKISMSSADRFWYYLSHGRLSSPPVLPALRLLISAPPDPFEEYPKEVARDASMFRS